MILLSANLVPPPLLVVVPCRQPLVEIQYPLHLALVPDPCKKKLSQEERFSERGREENISSKEALRHLNFMILLFKWQHFQGMSAVDIKKEIILIDILASVNHSLVSGTCALERRLKCVASTSSLYRLSSVTN